MRPRKMFRSITTMVLDCLILLEGDRTTIPQDRKPRTIARRTGLTKKQVYGAIQNLRKAGHIFKEKDIFSMAVHWNTHPWGK